MADQREVNAGPPADPPREPAPARGSSAEPSGPIESSASSPTGSGTSSPAGSAPSSATERPPVAPSTGPGTASSARPDTTAEPDATAVPNTAEEPDATAVPNTAEEPDLGDDGPDTGSAAPSPPAPRRPRRDRWTGSVDVAVSRAGEGPVAVTALVDAMLALHGPEYLRGWSSAVPTWPERLLTQPASSWMAELDPLVAGSQLFGRVAIVGWCLLDDRVAAEAQRCGLLAGVAGGVTPRLPDFLTAEGLRRLRKLAPLVALTVGEEPPEVDLPSLPVTHAALARQPIAAPRSVGRWAVSLGETIVVGQGTRAHSEAPEAGEHDGGRPGPGLSSPIPPGSGARFDLAPTQPIALGWSRSEVLHATTAGGPLLRFYPRPRGWESTPDWPAPSAAAIGEQSVVCAVADPAELLWATTGRAGPVALPGAPSPVRGLAVSGTRVAALGSTLALGGPDAPWVEARIEYPEEASVVAAATAHVVVAGQSGRVHVVGWDGTGVSVADTPAMQVRLAAGSERLVALGGDTSVVLLDGVAVVGRWQAPAGESVSAVALSPDSRALLVATRLADPAADPGARIRIWRIDAVPEVPLTEYSADTPDGDDVLGVQPTVEALAAIVCAVDVQPPLSVGLFGAWGSGKSFFMRLLEKRVTQLSAEAHDSGRPQSALWAWRNIRQIRFNAWHYAAADVWAGMLEHLVKELARPASTGRLELELPDELSALEQRRVRQLAGALDRERDSDLALNRAEAALRVAEQQASQKSRLLSQATSKAENARAEAAKTVLDAEVRAQLDAVLTSAGLEPLGDSLAATRRDIVQARASLQSAAGLVRAGDQRRLAWALAAVLAVGVGVTVLLRVLNVDLAGAVGTVTALVGCVGALARWVGTSARTVADRLATLDAAEDEARRLQAAIEREVHEAKQRVATAKEELAEAQRRREQAAQEVDVARARVETTTPGSLLQEYLEGRNSAEDYRGQLGLIGTVHRDLQVISDAVAKNNGDAKEQSERPLDDVVNRIVLYVDDLDRCPPTVVVRVLEAVSMLMTFPMFVVVVAVDAHWISKSLAAVYPTLLTGRDVTPDNYLEKIFQLPVWLERPSDDAAAVMARTLLQGSRDQGGAQAVGGRAGTAADTPSADQPAGAQGSQAAGGAAPAPSATVSLATTPPAAVILEQSEVTAIEALAPLIARSPRALKRYVNTYRVLKALIEPEDLEPARLLLGVATGRPDLGERLLADIQAAPDERTLGELVARWPAEDRQWLTSALPAQVRAWPALRCGPLEPVAARVRRFVFHAQHPAELTAGQPARGPSDGGAPAATGAPAAGSGGGDGPPSPPRDPSAA